MWKEKNYKRLKAQEKAIRKKAQTARYKLHNNEYVSGRELARFTRINGRIEKEVSEDDDGNLGYED